ncbi:M23 family metallopeptidase [Bacillus taeanensis]|uniref:M23 family peptidase n=1 Tax=Bacillus taeanensis TaxID=273032 RepID=A0A366Y3M2_9BACI|nr:M23 family metallopeptidase [Bacillus taeanensis]RBW71599.1 M23 family peptidase [Bacillus taeanensis]
MKKSIDEVRKRHKERKKERTRYDNFQSQPPFIEEEKEHSISSPFKKEEQPLHPLFNKEAFLIKITLSVCLFLIVGILFKQNTPFAQTGQQVVRHSFQQEFQFAAVSSWYEEQFGKPLVLFPEKKTDTNNEQKNQFVNSFAEAYAVPASGKVTENFSKNGQGILLETGPDEQIGAVREGFVSFIGEEEDIGKTVVIQHDDGSESWYGKLANIEVKLYDFVERGEQVGSATTDQDANLGIFYFALKQGESFIDPIQVISFD